MGISFDLGESSSDGLNGLLGTEDRKRDGAQGVEVLAGLLGRALRWLLALPRREDAEVADENFGLGGSRIRCRTGASRGSSRGSSASFLSTMTMSSSSMSLGVVSLGAPTAGVDPEVTLAVVAVDRFLLLGDMNAMSLSRRPREISAESCRAWLVLINVGYLLTYYWMADCDWQL